MSSTRNRRHLSSRSPPLSKVLWVWLLERCSSKLGLHGALTLAIPATNNSAQECLTFAAPAVHGTYVSLHLLTSGCGTERTSSPPRPMSGYRGRADIAQSSLLPRWRNGGSKFYLGWGACGVPAFAEAPVPSGVGEKTDQ